jgi:hypothetical protein
MRVSPLDKAALDKSLSIIMNSPDAGRRQQVTIMTKQDGWFEAAEFASYHCQMQALNLKPWETPPCLAAPDDTPAGRFLRRMIAAGLSKFEPDPIQSFEDKAA